MSRERVIKALFSLGMEKKDIEVYVFLAREGPHESHSIGEALGMNDQEIVNRLEILKKKGVVKAMGEIVPAQFFAVPFEKVVDLLTDANLKQAQHIEENKQIILKNWDSMLKENPKVDHR